MPKGEPATPAAGGGLMNLYGYIQIPTNFDMEKAWTAEAAAGGGLMNLTVPPKHGLLYPPFKCQSWGFDKCCYYNA